MRFRMIIPLGLAAVCWAQQAAAPSRIKINLVGGQGSVNNIGMRVAAQPAVEVLDEKNAPVEGAEVIFYAPADGPGGSFFGGMRSHTVSTDAKGMAKANGFIPNDQPGKFQILVRATAGAAVADATIMQSNSQGPNRGSSASASRKSLWTKVAIAAAVVAIGGGVAAARGGDSATTAAAAAKRPVSIGAGPITVGAPR